ncbi:hypothetical protein VSR34_21865 [Paraburkholderia sp. JHI2823]|uniref:hypothetical protein n=1 Tax=Paraburkholderia sp. JHI2823 TaxID=3112960 RepID=UPI003174743F
MGFDSDLVRFMAHSTQYLLGHLSADTAHEPEVLTALQPLPEDARRQANRSMGLPASQRNRCRPDA